MLLNRASKAICFSSEQSLVVVRGNLTKRERSRAPRVAGPPHQNKIIQEEEEWIKPPFFLWNGTLYVSHMGAKLQRGSHMMTLKPSDTYLSITIQVCTPLPVSWYKLTVRASHHLVRCYYAPCSLSLSLSLSLSVCVSVSLCISYTYGRGKMQLRLRRCASRGSEMLKKNDSWAF